VLAGLRVELEADRRIGDEVVLVVPDVDLDLRLTAAELADEPATAITRLERRIQGLDGKLETTRASLDEATREAERARDRLGRPFEQGTKLDQLRRRQREIDEALTAAETAPSAGSDAARMIAQLDSLATRQPSGLSR
jgi:hypothetical protein